MTIANSTHQASMQDETKKSITLEPRPLSTGNILVVPSITTLPENLKEYAEDYIEALRGASRELDVLETTFSSLPSQNARELTRTELFPASLVQKIQEIPSVPMNCREGPAGTDAQPAHESTGPYCYSRTSRHPHPSLPSEEKNMVWLNDYQVGKWMDRFRELQAFFKLHGHCVVPRDYPDPSLLFWVKRQRRSYQERKLGRRTYLTSARIELLNSLNFEWDHRAKSWLQNYNKLVAYLEYQPCQDNPKIPLAEYDKSLCRWYRRQHHFLRLFLTQERQKQLGVGGKDPQIRMSRVRNPMTKERAEMLLSKLGRDTL